MFYAAYESCRLPLPIVMLRPYVKPIADKLFIYFNKCGVLRTIGKIIKVNNDRGKM